ncbi:MAG: dihydrodipicolinate synthase family protein [Ignavibacteriales bacterium]|nr:dihydrodipicolinate synthase family protein [Ignavibacteriales bacterium]
MRKQKLYHGVIAPMVTPVTETGEIHAGSVEKLVDYVIQAGNFPFILGTTGEIASNSLANRDELVKLTAKFVNGRKILYAGITDNCIANTINTANKYADFGANAFVVHLPYFFPLTSDLMLKYYETIAENSPLPIVIYNITSITHMSIPIDVIEKLSTHPNIVGLKDSERDYDRVEKLAKLFKDREDFSLFIGWTNKSSQALLLGFDGIIPNTSNVTPALFQSLYESAFKGDEQEAMKFQDKAEGLSKLVQNNKTMVRTIPELKAIMNHLGICTPYVLPPLVHLTENENKELIKNYKNLGL